MTTYVTYKLAKETLVDGWSSDDVDGIDFDASVGKFLELVEDEFKSEFPGADITVDETSAGFDKYEVDPEEWEDKNSTEQIAQGIVGKVYGNMKWIVNK